MSDIAHEKTDAAIVRNGLFLKLAVVALCLSLSSSVSYWLSFLGGRLAYSVGSPTDEAILYSFLYGLALSQAITLFLPRGSLRRLISWRFVGVFFRSLVIVVPCWLIIAFGGSTLVNDISGVTGEDEWYQISLVLVSTSLTFFTWHLMYHRQNSHVHGSVEHVTTEEGITEQDCKGQSNCVALGGAKV